MYQPSTITVSEALEALLAVTAILDVQDGPEDSASIYCDGHHAFDIPNGVTTIPASLLRSALNDLAEV